jgi:2-C-methyl-D-erythritol 2,4-cyclodiphosphate synthase
MSMRIGSGLDVHAFGPAASGSSVVLAGVHIPSPAPLEGHSDADVVAHAAIDALLGAAGLGDIGQRFGVDDPALLGADSMRMLATVVAEVGRAGWHVGNLDVTVVAATPRLGGHRDGMRDRLAETLAVAREAVSVKATTTDGLGSIGRGEGIAVWAVCLLEASTGSTPSPVPGSPEH